MPAQRSMRRILNCRSRIQPSLEMNWYRAVNDAVTASSLARNIPAAASPV